MQTKLEKPKLKHNKKRNTAFLFESLVKELTKAVVYRNENRQKIISSLIKEHFKKNSILDKELTLYKQLYETKQFPQQSAEKLIDQVKVEHEKLSETEIFNEQSRLIAKINKTLGFEVYNNFVPNYKTLASISQIFSKDVEPRKKVLLEREIFDVLVAPQIVEKQEKTIEDRGFLKTFYNKFNKTYSGILSEQQKQLLSKYITHQEDDVDLKIYLNEEISRIKKELESVNSFDIIKENVELKDKVNKTKQYVDSIKIEVINEELIKKVMIIQDFLSEVNK